MKLSKKILEQHKKEKVVLDKPYLKFESVKDIFKFLKTNYVFCLILVLVSVGVYLNGVTGEFVSDDIGTLFMNPAVSNVSLALRTGSIHTIVTAILFTTFNATPIPFHVFNVVLHIIIVLLAFAFLSNIFPKRVATFSSLLFAVHPVIVEAVTWVSGGVYLFYALAFFTTALLFIIYKNTNSKGYLYASVATFTLFLLSIRDTQLLFIPLGIVVIDQFLLEDKFNFDSVLKTTPFFVVGGLYALIIRSVVTSRIDFVSPAQQSASYFIRLPYSITNSIKLLVLPDKLTLYHDQNLINNYTLIAMVVATIGIVVLTLLLVRLNRKAAGLIMFAAVSVFYLFSPIQLSWFVAERYLYFAALSFTTLVVIALVYLEQKTKFVWLSMICTAILLVGYSGRTVIRNTDWLTRKSLWEATLGVNPQSARTYNNLGDVYGREGDTKRSIEAFRIATEIDPNYADATHNLGLAYSNIGKLDKAEEYLLKSVELNPRIFQGYYNLAVIEYRKGNIEKVREYLEKALAINPDYEYAKRALESLPSEE